MVVDIKELEDILAKSSYLNGSVPSKHDFEMFEQLSYPDVKHSQHLLRWYTNIGNFTIEERMYLISDSKDSEKEEEKDRNDEDFDVFGEDDDEDLERRAKLAQHNIDEKKKKAGKVDIQKSMCILEVKPYDDETDLVELGKKVRACTRDGLVWGEGLNLLFCLVYMYIIIFLIYLKFCLFIYLFFSKTCTCV